MNLEDLKQGSIKLKDIKITPFFKQSAPSVKKMEKRREEYQNGKKLRIIVNPETKKLVKGYTYYTLAKELNLKTVPCYFVNAEPKTFKDNIPEDIRQSVYEEDNYKCYICGDKVSVRNDYHINAATVDHVKPLANGGFSVKSNLRCCCYFCNHTKGNSSYSPILAEEIRAYKQCFKEKGITMVTRKGRIKYGIEPFEEFTKKFRQNHLLDESYWQKLLEENFNV